MSERTMSDKLSERVKALRLGDVRQGPDEGPSAKALAPLVELSVRLRAAAAWHEPAAVASLGAAVVLAVVSRWLLQGPLWLGALLGFLGVAVPLSLFYASREWPSSPRPSSTSQPS